MLLVLAALIFWPDVSLFLPRLIVPDMLGRRACIVGFAAECGSGASMRQD
jgi:hypothetical protein